MSYNAGMQEIMATKTLDQLYTDVDMLKNCSAQVEKMKFEEGVEEVMSKSQNELIDTMRNKFYEILTMKFI